MEFLRRLLFNMYLGHNPLRRDSFDQHSRMNPDVLDHDVTRDCKSSKSLFRRSDGLDTFVEHLTSLVERCCYSTLYPLEPLPGEYIVL